MTHTAPRALVLLQNYIYNSHIRAVRDGVRGREKAVRPAKIAYGPAR